MTITFNSLLLSSLSPTVISPNKPHLIYIRIIMNYCTNVVHCLPVHLSVCRSVALRSIFNPWEIPKKSPRSLDSSALLSHARARVGPCAYVLPLTHTHTRVRYVCVCKDCARSSAVVGSRRTVTMNGCLWPGGGRLWTAHFFYCSTESLSSGTNPHSQAEEGWVERRGSPRTTVWDSARCDARGRRLLSKPCPKLFVFG